ncbi:unnamed protein product [Arctogadus glacialis]
MLRITTAPTAIIMDVNAPRVTGVTVNSVCSTVVFVYSPTTGQEFCFPPVGEEIQGRVFLYQSRKQGSTVSDDLQQRPHEPFDMQRRESGGARSQSRIPSGITLLSRSVGPLVRLSARVTGFLGFNVRRVGGQQPRGPQQGQGRPAHLAQVAGQGHGEERAGRGWRRRRRGPVAAGRGLSSRRPARSRRGGGEEVWRLGEGDGSGVPRLSRL